MTSIITETKEEFDLDIQKEVCAMQLSKDLFGVTKVSAFRPRLEPSLFVTIESSYS